MVPIVVALLCMVLCSTALPEPFSEPDYDKVIASAHEAAAKNRKILLDTAWRWRSDMPASTCKPNDICHKNKCRHCGCHAGSVPCPGPPPPPHSYPGCSNQVQCGAMPTAQITLFKNENQTEVDLANQWLEAQFTNKSADWWKMTFHLEKGPNASFSGPPLENSYNVAVFTMFNSQSRWVKAGTVAPLSPKAEQGMKEFWFEFVQRCAKYFPGEATGNPLRLHDSENIDSVRHTGCYFGATTLARFVEYADRTLPDQSTVREAAKAWERFSSDWLQAKALHGMVAPRAPVHCLQQAHMRIVRLVLPLT